MAVVPADRGTAFLRWTAADALTLEAFARLPSDTLAVGPTSGRFIAPANGRTAPFVNSARRADPLVPETSRLVQTAVTGACQSWMHCWP